jgi:hypothetical protein
MILCSTGGMITFEYGCNGQSKDQSSVYTRTTNYSFLLTVVRGLECINVDILPYQSENFHAFMATAATLKSVSSVEELVINSPTAKDSPTKSLFSPTTHEERIHGLQWGSNDFHHFLNSFDKTFCLLTLDLKNNWHKSVSIFFKLSHNNDDDDEGEGELAGDQGVNEKSITETIIMPNNTKR